MISIIVPVYNGERFIEKCLHSIAEQECKNLEIIIIDDGSTDGTYIICEKYASADKRIRLIRQKNAGVSATRNRGIKEASGEYIMFVDADDELALLDVPQKCIEEESDIVIFDYEVCEKKKRRHSLYEGKDERTLSKKEFIYYACQNRLNSAWAKLFRRSLLIEHGIVFDESMLVAEDAKFVLAVIQAAKKISYESKVVYRYNHSFDNGDARLSRYPTKIQEDSARIYQYRIEVLASLEKNGEITEQERKRLMVEVESQFVKDIFEAQGSLLVLGAHSGEMIENIKSIISAIYDRRKSELSTMVFLKCLLLKYQLKLPMWMYAILRELYIRVR